VVLSGTGTRNVFSGFALNKPEHPLPFHFVSPILIALIVLAAVDFDSLVRTADFLRAAQHIVQHDLSTEFSDGCRNELLLLLVNVSRNTVNDVLREEQNLHKVQVNLLKTRTVLD
jgi:hypothetical protein